MGSNDYYTFSEYLKKNPDSLTASMEDYLEMIYKLTLNNGFTRINELSQALNIQPPSATKMVQRLAEMGYIKYEKYGYIMLEDKGKLIGAWFLKRHNIIENFMRVIGVKESTLLEETEKIEHMLSNETTLCFEKFVTFMINNPDIIKKYETFKTNNL